MKNTNPRELPITVSADELKLIDKYREALEKLKPGQSTVTRAWSFPLIESSGDAIYCSVGLSWKNTDAKMSKTQVKVES